MPPLAARAMSAEQFDSGMLCPEWLHVWRPQLEPAFKWIREHLEELRGKDVACWCPLTSPCHGDVLLYMANMEPPLLYKRGTLRLSPDRTGE